ncbi:MAG: 50S ribosomal protein L18 [uncultured bacterium]|nr:MAG: 50S ribosomal protein L18 [uncultured bacterium]OGT37167.1 MAG: 50S ribosomal protein L18 [Gammaproteobacteria bacterium RIFCSPHIGHO2_12_FULL_38_14]
MTIADKKTSRIRRAGKTRHTINRLGEKRLSIFRSSNHIYAQVFSSCGSKVLVSAASVEKDIKSALNHCGNIKAAQLVGKLLAERCKNAGFEKIAFDRSGYSYHGCVKALAEAAREGGIQF